MSDWIESLAENANRKKADELAEEEIRQQKANIIKGRFPTFWEALLRQVDNDCSELRKKLPDDMYYHFRKEPDHYGGFTLTCEAMPPLRQLTVRPDVDRQCIDVNACNGRPSTVIVVTVAGDDLLSLTWKEKTYAGVVDLSQALIEYCISGQFRS